MDIKKIFESFGEEFWKFISKYLIKGLISFVICTIIYLLTKNNNYVLNDLGKVWYLLLIYAIVFVLLDILNRGFKKIISKIEVCKYNKNREQQNFAENVEFVKNFYDNLEIIERNLFDYLIDTNNSPVAIFDEYLKYGFNGFLEVRQFKSEEKTLVYDPITKKETNVIYPCYLFQCKLKEELYEMVKEMKNRNIKISKF